MLIYCYIYILLIYIHIYVDKALTNYKKNNNNKNNCLNDLPDFGVQLLSETQGVGI